MGRCVYSVVNSPKHQLHYILPKTDAGQNLDGEFKLLRIRELDNDDVDVKPDSIEEHSPPNLSIGQRVVVQCGADIGCIG